jgi:protein-tyrosine-phosphatase
VEVDQLREQVNKNSQTHPSHHHPICSNLASIELLDNFDLIVVMKVGHKEAICIEFPLEYSRVYLLSEIVDGIVYNIPDPAASNINPKEIRRELATLIAKCKERILFLANSLSRPVQWRK